MYSRYGNSKPMLPMPYSRGRVDGYGNWSRGTESVRTSSDPILSLPDTTLTRLTISVPETVRADHSATPHRDEVGEVVHTHSSSNQNSVDQGPHVSFSPTEFDKFIDDDAGNFQNLPYFSYLERTQSAILGIDDLVSLVRGIRWDLRGVEPRNPRSAYVSGEHIVVGEILKKDSSYTVHWHDVNCADAHSLQQHSQILAGAGNTQEVAVRYLIMDDFSPRAAEVLGNNFGIDPSVIAEHLHQSLTGCPIENFPMRVDPIPSRAVQTPFAFRTLRSRSEKDQTSMVVCPTDMHVVPDDDMLGRVPIIRATFEEHQLQRVPRSSGSNFEEQIIYQLGLRSFMRPSINEDFGPFLPLAPVPGDISPRSTPFQRITLDRTDHVILHIPGHVEIPTVLILRTPSAWNNPIDSTDLGDLHRELSDGKARWEVRGSPDCFQFNPVPDFVPNTTSLSMTGSPDAHTQQPQGYRLDHGDQESVQSNLALCKVLVEWHLHWCTENTIGQERVGSLAQIYFLERALTRLQTLSVEDHKRAYSHLTNNKLRPGERRRLLEYCRTRTIRWEHFVSSYSRIMDGLFGSTSSESDAAQRCAESCRRRLQQIAHQVEDQLHKTKDFVKLQLDYIEADQQRELMNNQIEFSQAQILESRKAIQQTETVRKLTILAFVFIPTSTVCSFFGMNIKELDNHPPIWIFFVTSILVITFILVIATANGFLHFLMRIFAALPNLPRGGEPDISQVKSWTAIVLFHWVHTPFAFIWKTKSVILHKWTLFISKGRAYWTGYQDSGLASSEHRDGPNPIDPFTDKGALMSYRLEAKFHHYQRIWRDFWHPPETNISNSPINPIPQPTYY